MEYIKFKIGVILAAIATHPVVLYINNYGFGWDEVKQILLVPIMGWSPLFIFYLFVLRSRLAIFLGGCVLLVGYPTTVELVNSSMDESSTAAIGFFSIPYFIILPSLILVAILDALVKWAVSKWMSSRHPH